MGREPDTPFVIPKFPRMLHLPWSPGGTRDDRRLSDASHFVGTEIVVTEKLDGSNICFTKDALLARSHSGSPLHPSFDYAKSLHASIRHLLPAWFTVFCEYVYAVHSIKYDELPSYVFVIGIRNEAYGSWLPWDETCQWAHVLGFPTVPILFHGHVITLDTLRFLTESEGNGASVFGPTREGVVIRVTSRFSDFERSVAKWVRSDHVQTDEHWSTRPLEKQPLQK